MKAFNKKLNDMKAKQGDSVSAVKQALAKAGLSKHITDNNKQTGDETMKESYKDKFNAQMKKFGIDSLDDLKSDEEKKKFFKAVDAAHTAKNESMTEELLSIAEGMQEGGPGSGPQGDNRFGRRTHGSNKKSGPIAKALSKVFKKKTPAKSAALPFLVPAPGFI
jgi:hypothetical protein